ncbi:MAG: hypothetical protein ACE366_10640 [Bradymonadia bacterium]
MKALSILLLSLLPALGHGKSARSFGAGVILGDPTGLSAKYFIDRTHALDGALDYDFADEAYHLHVGYLLHLSPFKKDFVPYVGIGGRLRIRDRDDKKDEERLGARAPLGIAWMPKHTPIDVFLEVAPVLNVLPDSDIDIDAGLGIRYWF